MQGFVGQKVFTLQKDASNAQDAVVGAVEKAEDVISVQDTEVTELEKQYVERMPDPQEQMLTPQYVDTRQMQRTKAKMKSFRVLY